MAQLIILEGPRTVGKSTVARRLREKIFGSTLINLTGFSEDGENGLRRIVKYHNSILDMLAGSNELFILDRSCISEMIYSDLYKGYTFSPHFESMMHKLFTQNKTLLIQMSADEWFLKQRIAERGAAQKAELFDSIEDNTTEVLIQSRKYSQFWTGEYESLKRHLKLLYRTDTLIDQEVCVTGLSVDLITDGITKTWDETWGI